MIKEAAALILVRDSDKGLEVCMLRRVETSGFAAGAYVFPGGAVDDQDKQLAKQNVCCHAETSDENMHVYKVAAVRETLEEAGILAASMKAGEQISDVSRHKLHQGAVSFETLLRENDARINLDEVVFYDHWITPEGAPKRFDTRFFISTASSEHRIMHDNKETDSSCWTLPKDILALYEQGDVKLMPVTHVQLKRLPRFDSVSDVLSLATTRNSIPVTEPIMNFGENGKPVSVTIHLTEGTVEYPVFQKRPKV